MVSQLLKEIIDELKAIKTDIRNMRDEFVDMKADIRNMKDEFVDMKADIRNMKDEFVDINTELKGIHKLVGRLEKDVAEIKYIINKGVFDDIARLEKRIEALEQKAG